MVDLTHGQQSDVGAGPSPLILPGEASQSSPMLFGGTLRGWAPFSFALAMHASLPAVGATPAFNATLDLAFDLLLPCTLDSYLNGSPYDYNTVSPNSPFSHLGGIAGNGPITGSGSSSQMPGPPVIYVLLKMLGGSEFDTFGMTEPIASHLIVNFTQLGPAGGPSGADFTFDFFCGNDGSMYSGPLGSYNAGSGWVIDSMTGISRPVF